MNAKSPGAVRSPELGTRRTSSALSEGIGGDYSNSSKQGTLGKGINDAIFALKSRPNPEGVANGLRDRVKASSIVLTGAFGVLGLLKDFKDKNTNWNARHFLYQLRSDKTGTRGALDGTREEAYSGANREPAGAG
jgi:hypothetical protein